MPNIDGLRPNIIAKDHGSRYCIHTCSTKTCHDIKEIYWFEDMKRDISKFVVKLPNCQ